jgi:hypothetical protein
VVAALALALSLAACGDDSDTSPNGTSPPDTAAATTPAGAWDTAVGAGGADQEEQGGSDSSIGRTGTTMPSGAAGTGPGTNSGTNGAGTTG